jgi:hypothetical protein
LHLFNFKSTKGGTKKGKRYVVQVEEYPYNTYAIKFYPKSLENSRNKYRVLMNDFDAPRIIRTCVQIMVDFYQRDPLASFAFTGTRTEKEETDENTIKYRVYKQVMVNFFPPSKFTHAENNKYSAYMLINRDTHIEDLEIKIKEMFERYYVIDLRQGD